METVTATDIHDDNDLLDVVVRSRQGTSTIATTDLHTFWVQTTHAWALAETLHRGDELHSDNGTTVTVVRTVQLSGHRNMWDLTVAHAHDFYVSVGAGSQTAVLVHNCGTSFANQALRDAHYVKHGADMGYDSAEAYEQGASDFVNSDGVTSIARSNGDQMFYRASTNEFAVTRAGSIATYFQPENGWSYFAQQVLGEPIGFAP